MQKEIHPEIKKTTITCACGEVYKTKSTGEDMRVEVCSSCHPFYTGKTRKAAKGGRVERFNKKYGLSEEVEVDVEEAKAERAKAEAERAKAESERAKAEARAERKGTETEPEDEE